MALSVKNPETERLARDLAAATGETVTAAITAALRERLDRIGSVGDRRAAVREQIARIAGDTAARWPPELREVDHGDQLYDEQGLPR